jgi:hypothetical protein
MQKAKMLSKTDIMSIFDTYFSARARGTIDCSAEALGEFRKLVKSIPANATP